MKTKHISLFLLLLLLPAAASAHVRDLSGLSGTETAWLYLKLGFTHIVPFGLDHILFVLSIFFLNARLKTVVWQATAFTIAHSVTLGMTMYGIITPPSYIVEPVIALSILFVAVENMITDQLRPARIFIVFAFGLIHGMGFASVLGDLGLPESRFFSSLITFNVGVELGQITVIIAAWLLIGKWFRERSWYRGRVVMPVNMIIAAVAAYWMIERTFFS